MSTIEKSIEVNVPVYTAYSQWTHFEEFPQFMEGVKEVKQLDVKRLHWKTEIAGQDKEWDAERRRHQRMGRDISPTLGCQIKGHAAIRVCPSGLGRNCRRCIGSGVFARPGRSGAI